MSRDINGNYTLPAGNPVTSGTVIASTWANNTMTDIAATLTSSLDRSGNGGMLQPLKLADGTVAAPGLTFVSEAGIGLYRVGLGQLGFATSGVQRAVVNAAGAWIVNAPSVGTAVTVNALAGAAGIIITSVGSWTQGAPGLTVKSTAVNGFAVLSLVPNNGVSGTSDVTHVVNGVTQEYFIINNISGGPTTFKNNAGAGAVTTMSLSTSGNLTLSVSAGTAITLSGSFPITIGSPASNICNFAGTSAAQTFNFLPNAVTRFTISDAGSTFATPASTSATLVVNDFGDGSSALVLVDVGTGADGRCVLDFRGNKTTNKNYIIGIDTTGGTAKSFEVRDITRGAVPFSIGTNGTVTINPGTAVSLSVTGAANQNTAIFQANTGAGTSFGPVIQAGTTAADIAFRVLIASGGANLFNIRGDGLIAFNGAVGQNKDPGWGAPTGNVLTTNFPGATATLVQTSQSLSRIITLLINYGFMSA